MRVDDRDYAPRPPEFGKYILNRVRMEVRPELFTLRSVECNIPEIVKFTYSRVKILREITRVNHTLSETDLLSRTCVALEAQESEET